jgi:thymidylate kinase
MRKTSIANRQVIAVEGPSGAGKSTLVSALFRALKHRSPSFSPEYVELAGGVQHVPAPPATSTEARLAAVEFFLAIEERRYSEHFRASGSQGPLVLDRSVYTLVAHSYAEEKIFRYRCCGDTWSRITRKSKVCWPGLILFLDVPPQELRRRHGEGRGTLFTDACFNAYFSEFFSAPIKSLNHGVLPAPAVVFLQGGQARQQVSFAALQEIRTFITH